MPCRTEEHSPLVTKNVTLDEEYCRRYAEAKPGPHVLLCVSDTGQGMDGATLEHIFEPFYTTKELGRGTGLGLAMVYGIVKQHGGHIVCGSDLNKGTRFEVYFPAISSVENSAKDTTGETPVLGTEAILLADDEDSVRELGERILLKNGYEVLTAANGMKALEVFSREKERLGLVILDLIMPGLGGKDCLRELLRIDPSTRVLISSGLSNDASCDECLEIGAKGFVAKPFKSEELLKEIRKALDEA